ncbi:MAG TPA: hypothetical protein VFW00_12110 [Rhodocyclaceae bacterium]|nr:hypothetical protein [Rhodocyclaceae bacterium]
MPKHAVRIVFISAILFFSISFLPAARADTGVDLIKAHAICDGSFFGALATDARRWSQEPAFKRRNGLAFFQVKNRNTAGPAENDDATVKFHAPHSVAGLPLTAYFDSDLSRWRYFSDHDLNFVTWGFYVGRTPAAVMTWLSKNAPGIWNALMQARPGTPDGMYCEVEVFEQGRWQASAEACDQALPVDATPHRVFAVRPRPNSGENDESILSCELWGVLPKDLLKMSRPDLPR